MSIHCLRWFIKIHISPRKSIWLVLDELLCEAKMKRKKKASPSWSWCLLPVVNQGFKWLLGKVKASVPLKEVVFSVLSLRAFTGQIWYESMIRFSSLHDPAASANHEQTCSHNSSSFREVVFILVNKKVGYSSWDYLFLSSFFHPSSRDEQCGSVDWNEPLLLEMRALARHDHGSVTLSGSMHSHESFV